MSTSELLKQLKDATLSHSETCSNLYQALSSGLLEEEAKIAEHGSQTNLTKLAQTLAETFVKEDFFSVKEALANLKAHFQDWEIQNENGENPAEAISKLANGKKICIHLAFHTTSFEMTDRQSGFRDIEELQAEGVFYLF